MPKPLSISTEQQDELLTALAEMSDDPLRFVLFAFPWGEAGTELETWDGPTTWQRRILEHIRDHVTDVDQAVRIAVASGHGIGKSTLVAWLILWALSTRDGTRGVVTAGTGTQLKTKTWPELAKWHNLFIANTLFEFNDTSIHSVDPIHKFTWRVDQVTWNKDRPEAFSGLHNQHKRILVIYDEASQIDDKIWEASDGIMFDKDTQIIWCAFGNPTRKTGRFYEAFNKFASFWHTLKVDSRTVPNRVNKLELDKLAEVYGEDSDYFKVRVLGEFPSAGTIQFIPSDIVQAARRLDAHCNIIDPMILGVDVARMGDNESVVVHRKGRDARTWPAVSFRNLPIDQLADRVANIIIDAQPDAVFVDEGGVGGGLVDFLRRLGHNPIGINFGSKPGGAPNGTLVANKRAEMYALCREWLRTGGCIEDSDDLEGQLTAVEYGFNKRDEILLESKDEMRSRGVPSPDWADALVLTFALPIAMSSKLIPPGRRHTVEYAGWSLEAA